MSTADPTVTGAAHGPTATTGRHPRPAGHGVRLLRTVIPTILLVALLAVLAALVVVPRLMGWVPLTVLSGSMEPTIPTGSQVVVEPVEGPAEAARLDVGDVITVMPYPENPTLVTHRIVAREELADGVRFTTQGDANAVPDDWEVSATQIRAEVRYWVPAAGYVATVLDGGQKSLALLVVVGGLLAYAAVQVLGAARESRPGRDG